MSFDLYFGTKFLRRLDDVLNQRAAANGIDLDPGYSDKKRAAVVRAIIAAPTTTRGQSENHARPNGERALPDCFVKLQQLIHEVDGRLSWKITEILAGRHVDPVTSESVRDAVLDELLQLTVRRAKDWANVMDEAACLAARFRGLFDHVAEALAELGAALPDDVKAKIAQRKQRDHMEGIAEEVAEIFKRRIPWPGSWEDLNRLLLVEKDADLVRLFDIAWKDKQKRTDPTVRIQNAVWRVAVFVDCQMQFSWDGKLRSRLFELTVRELNRQRKPPIDPLPPVRQPVRQPALIEVPIEDGVLVIDASADEVPFGVARLSILTQDIEPVVVKNVLIAIAKDRRHRHLRRRMLLLENLAQDSDGDIIACACPVTRRNLNWFRLDETELRTLLDTSPAEDDVELQKNITELIELLHRDRDLGHGRQ